MNKINIEIADKWMLDSLDEWQWSGNMKRYKNYLAVVQRGEDGRDHMQWCSCSDNSDEFFSLREAKEGDILMAGCKDTRKGRSISKAYYGVVAMTTDEAVLVRETTYLKAKKALAEAQQAERGGEE